MPNALRSEVSDDPNMSLPPLVSKPRFVPADLTAKALKALAALDGWAQRGVGLSAKEIAQIANLSVRDLGRILNRLSSASRISRTKSEDMEDGYFRYWITPTQRKNFYLQATVAAQLKGINTASTLGDASLDDEIIKQERLLTSLNDIKAMKEHLEMKTLDLVSELNSHRENVREIRLRIIKHTNDIEKIKKTAIFLCESESKILDEKQILTSKIGVRKPRASKDRDQKEPDEARFMIGSVDLSTRLSFIRKLRERPALSDMNLLQVIEDDYAKALQRATKD